MMIENSNQQFIIEITKLTMICQQLLTRFVTANNAMYTAETGIEKKCKFTK